MTDTPSPVQAPLLVVPGHALDVIGTQQFTPNGPVPAVLVSIRNAVAVASFPLDLEQVERVIEQLRDARARAAGLEVPEQSLTVPNRAQRRANGRT